MPPTSHSVFMLRLTTFILFQIYSLLNCLEHYALWDLLNSARMESISIKSREELEGGGLTETLSASTPNVSRAVRSCKIQ